MNAIAIAPNFATEEELWELLQDGYRRCLDAGTLIVWELNPRTKKLTVFRPDVPALKLGVGDTLDAEPLLPGWSLPLDRIF